MQLPISPLSSTTPSWPTFLGSATGIFYNENDEHSWYQISKAIGQAMVALGLTTDAEPTPFAVEEYVKYFGREIMDTKSRCRSNPMRALVWKPKYTTQDMLKTIRSEVQAWAKKGKEGRLAEFQIWYRCTVQLRERPAQPWR